MTTTEQPRHKRAKAGDDTKIEIDCTLGLAATSMILACTDKRLGCGSPVSTLGAPQVQRICDLLKPQYSRVMFTGGVIQDDVYVYSISNGTRTRVTRMPQRRCNHGMAAFCDQQGDHEIFAVGGCVDCSVSGSVISLKVPSTSSSPPRRPSTGTPGFAAEWEAMPDMKVKRQNVAVAALDDKVYVIGGRTGADEEVGTVEVFSVKERKWVGGDCSPVPPDMSTKRCKMGVAVVGKKIYVIGGHSGWDVLKSVEVLDTETNTWSPGSPMKTILYPTGAAVVDDRYILVFGAASSCDDIGQVEMFDTVTGTWYLLPVELENPQLVVLTFAVGHKIFVFYHESVKVLDVDNMNWSGSDAIDYHSRFCSAVCF